MKTKSCCHSVSSVGRRSFLRKIGIASASLASVLALLIASPAIAQNTSLKFNGGIGVMPVVLSGTTPAPNIVKGIQPAGTPWRISALTAEVRSNGHIHVEGRRLLLAGGNGIGTNGGQSVIATLITGTSAPFTVSSTPVAKAVALAADGDFTIDDVLSPTPSNFSNPTLLIQNGVGLVWFAVGIPVVQ